MIGSERYSETRTVSPFGSTAPGSATATVAPAPVAQPSAPATGLAPLAPARIVDTLIGPA